MDSPAPSNAPDLDNTNERQAALRRYHVLDTAPEETFDRITSLVATVCNVPTALISLINKERQWFKSCFGFDRRETDVETSFCVHAVHEGQMIVVEDAANDPRFADNPMVTGPPHVRFYAGAPLTTPDGVHIGTLCIMDYEPRTFDASQREILTRLADTVVDQFERRSAEAQVRQLVEKNPQPMYVYAVDDGTLLTANAAACEQYGYDNSAFLSLTADDLEAPSTIQPAFENRSMHERADGSCFAVRLREREVLFNGREARLAVPQLLSAEPEEGAEIVFQARPNGTLQFLSADWEAATGRPVADAIDTRLPDLIVSDDRAAAVEVLTPLADGTQESCRHEARFRTVDGERPFALRARVARNDNDDPVGVIGTLTPLGPAQPFASDASAPDASEEPRSSAPSAPTSSSSSRTGDAPDSAPSTPSSQRSPAETPSADPSTPASSEPAPSPETADEAESVDPFDLTAHLHALLDRRADNHEDPAVTIQRTLPDTAVLLPHDPDAVEEVVNALLDNALTHTEEGSVTLRLTADEETAEIEIEDTGTGAEERFMQVYTQTASSPTLHDIHETATRMGIALNMDDAASGTRFRLTVPRASASDASVPGAS